MELNHPHSLAGHLPILRAYQGIGQALGQPRLPGARCPLQDQISLVAEALERIREIRFRLKTAVVQDVVDGIRFKIGLFRIGFSFFFFAFDVGDGGSDSGRSILLREIRHAKPKIVVLITVAESELDQAPGEFVRRIRFDNGDAISVEVPVLWCCEWRPVDLDRLSVLCAFSYCPDRFDPHAGDMLVPVVKGEPISLHKGRSEEHTSELQSLMRISYAVFCLKKNTTQPKDK